MATRKARFHRLTARVLVFSLAVDPFVLAQIQATKAPWDGVAADLRTVAVPGGIDLPSPPAAAPATAAATATTAKAAPTDRYAARRELSTSFPAPTALPAGSAEEAAAYAEDLAQRRAPVISLVKTLLWPRRLRGYVLDRLRWTLSPGPKEKP